MTQLAGFVALLRGVCSPIAGQRELWSLQRRWRLAFASEQSSWSESLRDFDWHVFSYGYQPHRSGVAAIALYESIPRTAMILAESLSCGPALECAFESTLSYAQLRNAWPGDLYVIDKAMSWTFVMTHEQAIGPFFAEAVLLEDEEGDESER